VTPGDETQNSVRGKTPRKRSFELPLGTIEIVTVGKDLMPQNDRYQVIVQDRGVSAVWVGFVSSTGMAPADTSADT
jgi:hypothetical protein